MTINKIVETMAKAMAENDALDFDKILHPMQSMYRSHARAALSALEAEWLVVVPREATDEMLSSAYVGLAETLPEIYSAMISAALGEKEGTDGT